MDSAAFITAFVTLFVIIDPIGLFPIFVSLTQGVPQRERRKIAIRACVTAFVILSIFAFLGEAVLGGIGISMPAFRIAGGILLFLTALDMLFERRTKRREDQAEEAEEDYPDPSIFPLAIPLLSGPGAITSVILLAGQDTGIQTTLSVLAVAALVLAIVFTLFLTASALERLLGRTGITVITRLLGMLLAALAVQFILDGLKNFGFAG
ncbi:MarC family protein [Shimia sp.]|jgi:multiple antibiotic resistance protein|uniref:MarC family protein n=1 Tax=unclassified Shimia TaxID=2630038 RepID=UPI0025D4C12A|nr:MarC family protein [Shimia sp.]MCH2066700.1 MarC family protein [Shimia sp.]